MRDLELVPTTFQNGDLEIEAHLIPPLTGCIASQLLKLFPHPEL
jgi:hypothetical protein